MLQIASPAGAVSHDARHLDWKLLLPGMLGTLIIALSVHVVMLQVLDIPYPTPSGQPAAVSLAKGVLNVVALAVFFRLARESLPGRLPFQALIVFLLDAGLRESLRGATMEGFVTTAYAYSFVHALGRVAPLLIRDLLLVLAAGSIRRWSLLVPVLIVIAAAMAFWLQPAIGAATGRLLAGIGLQEHEDVYLMPYGWRVLIPAYATFVEPVISCTIMSALVWPRFAGRSVTVWLLSFAVLVALIRGSLELMALDSFFVPQPLWLALLSTGQFCFETLALAALSAAVWRLAGGSLRSAG